MRVASWGGGVSLSVNKASPLAHECAGGGGGGDDAKTVAVGEGWAAISTIDLMGTRFLRNGFEVGVVAATSVAIWKPRGFSYVVVLIIGFLHTYLSLASTQVSIPWNHGSSKRSSMV